MPHPWHGKGLLVHEGAYRTPSTSMWRKIKYKAANCGWAGDQVELVHAGYAGHSVSLATHHITQSGRTFLVGQAI